MLDTDIWQETLPYTLSESQTLLLLATKAVRLCNVQHDWHLMTQSDWFMDSYTYIYHLWFSFTPQSIPTG